MKSIFDPLRKRNVAKTPEEEIRQQTIQVLLTQKLVPAPLIESEFSLNAYSKTTKDRVDIIVHNYQDVKKPWLLVECKAKGAYTFENLEIQVNRYLHIITPKYIWLALGNENKFFMLKDNKYEQIQELPIYNKENASFVAKE